MRGRHAGMVAILFVGLAVPALGEAGGLSNTETFGGFQFNFNNPGARALGMGGAFIGVADDATAVATNPAGLVILQRPELSGEVKFSRFRNRVKAFTNTPAEGQAGIVHDRDFDNSVTTPSFFSLVFPTERLVTAVFVREPVNFESRFHTESVTLSSGTQLFPVESSLQVTALNVGAGIGLNLSKDYRLLPDIGGSIEFSNGVVHSNLRRFSGTSVVSAASVDGSDIGIGFNVGALWRPAKKFSLGAVFRRGPRYNMTQTTQPGGVAIPFGSGFLPLFSPDQVSDFSLKVPDVYGVGAAFRPSDRLTISGDVIQIRYSQLLDGFRFAFPDAGDAPLRRKDFTLDDAVEFHVGVEYIMFVGTIPVAARAGFYTDPDHRIRYTGLDRGERLLFPGGRDQYHATGGLGIVPFPGVQFDFATNISREVHEFSISTVLRF